MERGRLVYVMGPSGAGKDSVIAFARAASDPARVAFAHRYITRAAGWFVLHWESHGLHYGIGREVELWLGSGRSVVVNGSRAYLPEALRRYPGLLPVLVTAPAEIRQARLAARRRASDGDLKARVARRVELEEGCDAMVEIDNSAALPEAGAALLRLLDGISRASP